MVYRKFGKSGIEVSALGFGCMRLPMIEKDGESRVNDELATPLLLRAVELGVNFFDTAWFYCNNDSQRAVGAALKSVRDRVYISTKLPLFLVEKSDDFDRYLETSLEQMGLEYLDFNHFHALTYSTWQQKILPLKLIDKAEKAMSKGLLKNLSFSFHGDAEQMSELIDTGAFSSILGQYNLIDRRNEKVFAYAKEKGVGTAVMGPLMGGNLVDGGEQLLSRLESSASSVAEMALRFVWGLKDVDMALSGMSNIQQLECNAAAAQRADDILPAERALVLQKAEELKGLADLYCTGCQYCDLCPQGIKPARAFQLYIQHHVWGLDESVKRRLHGRSGMGSSADPALCNACGACAARCPQKIDIPAELARIWPVLLAL